jgi:predicted esterase
MKSLLLLTAITALILAPHCDLLAQNRHENFESYAQVRDSLDILYDLEKYTEAIDLIKSVYGLFPEDDFELTRSHALFCRMAGLYEECMDVFEAGHKQGYFYFIIPRMQKYEPFAEFERFDDIVTEDARLREKANKKSETLMEVETPDDYSPDRRYPLLIVLHGGGSSIDRAKKHWHSAKLSDEYIVAFLQSYMCMDLITYGWRTSDKRAHEDIKRIYDKLMSDYSVDSTRIVIAGISAGGSMAFDLLINNIIPVAGVFGVCPGKPQDFESANISAAGRKNVRAYILGGETDFYLSNQNEMAEAFKTSGLKYKQVVIEDLGHDYPEDFARWIDTALDFLIDYKKHM